MGCKIEKAGLSGVIQELVASGVTTRSAVAEVLRRDHQANLSDATVGRFLSRIKSEAHSKAFQIISDHVDKVVPDDLNALEAMEAQSYQWAMEAARPQARRLAEAAGKIRDNLDAWRQMLSMPDDDKAVQAIIDTCMGYVQEDAREQDQRLKAMRMAANIIELKLSRAGLLNEDTKGKIVLLSRADAGLETRPANDDSSKKIIHFSREALQ